MSARVPVGFLETTLHWQVPGQHGEVLNSFGWEGDAPLDPGDRLAIIAAFGDLVAAVSEQVSVTSVDFVIGQDGPDDIVISEPCTLAGTLSGVMQPCNSAYLVRKTTSTPGRRGRGRSYLPGLNDGFVTDEGLVDVGVVSDVNNGFLTLVDDMATAGYEPRLFHSSTPFTPSVVTSFVCQRLIATQRRRLRG